MSLINLKDLNLSEIQETLYQFKLKIYGKDVGYHESKLRGAAFDFFDTKIYEQGDSLKSIDYKRWGKTEVYWVKRRESEKSQKFRIVIDLPESVLSENTRFNRLYLIKNFLKCLIFIFNNEHDQFTLELLTPQKKIVLDHKNLISLAQLDRIFKKLKYNGLEIPKNFYQSFSQNKQDSNYTIWVSDFIKEENNFEEELKILKNSSKKLLLLHFLLPEEFDLESLQQYDLINFNTKQRKSLVEQSQINEYKTKFDEYFRNHKMITNQNGINWYQQYSYFMNLKEIFNKLIN